MGGTARTLCAKVQTHTSIPVAVGNGRKCVVDANIIRDWIRLCYNPGGRDWGVSESIGGLKCQGETWGPEKRRF